MGCSLVLNNSVSCSGTVLDTISQVQYLCQLDVRKCDLHLQVESHSGE